MRLPSDSQETFALNKPPLLKSGQSTEKKDSSSGYYGGNNLNGSMISNDSRGRSYGMQNEDNEDLKGRYKEKLRTDVN